MPVRVVAWRAINKGVVVGSVDLVLGKSLEIFGCLVMRSNRSVWVAFPGKPQIGADDKAIWDGRGKQQFTVILKWSDRVSGDRFSHAVLSAIASKHGEGALRGDGAP
jgi:hypothetical protein